MKTFSNLKGKLLLDIGYPIFLQEQIRKAEKSIYIMMFYISFDCRKKDSLVNKIVMDLIAARKRGVSVNVMLDRDGQNDVYNSRLINKEVVEIFKKNRISVHFDSALTVLHSKITIIDEKQILIGSHDWTLNSFYKYNETSIALDSVELASYYIEDFYLRQG